MKKRTLAVVFVIFLILTYGFGFNLLCSYNLQSTFSVYSFYDEKITPLIVGVFIAAVTALCIFGGGKRIVKITGLLVPFMGIIYVLVTILVMILNVTYLPTVFREIFKDAFDFKSIGAGIAGAEYVQRAMHKTLGNFGPIFITFAMVLFAFTTLIGNLYYVDNGLKYLHNEKTPSKLFMTLFHILCNEVEYWK